MAVIYAIFGWGLFLAFAGRIAFRVEWGTAWKLFFAGIAISVFVAFTTRSPQNMPFEPTYLQKHWIAFDNLFFWTPALATLAMLAYMFVVKVESGSSREPGI